MATKPDAYSWSVVKPTAKAERSARDIWAEYNAQASANQTKPLAPSRCLVMAVMLTLNCIPDNLRDDCKFDVKGDRSKATDRFRLCNNSSGKADWVTRIEIPAVCESRSASPRKDNQLRECVDSIMETIGGLYTVTPDRNDGDYAFIVRVSK
jgi:hypothetical protein